MWTVANNNQNSYNSNSLSLHPITDVLKAQLRRAVCEMLKNAPSHQLRAINALERLFNDATSDQCSNWEKIFNEEPVLVTLYRSNHYIFSTWHEGIHVWVNKSNEQEQISDPYVQTVQRSHFERQTKW